MGGPQQLMPTLTQFQPVDTPERLEASSPGSRPTRRSWRPTPTSCERHSERADGTIDRHRADHRPDRADALDPDRRGDHPSSVQGASDADREQIRAIVRDVVYPADAAFLDVLRGEYRHASREEPGIWSAPNGDAIYRTAIRSWTTFEMDPREIHQIGLDELEAIEDERRGIAHSRPWRRHDRVPRELDAEAANTPGTKDELVQRATEDIERAMAAAPQYFGTLPTAGCDVRSVEEYKEKDAPFAYYYPPAADGSRDGIYYANGYDLRPASTRNRVDHVPRGRARPSLSRSRWRWRTRG